MGDRYTISYINCAYCQAKQKNIDYAPTCNMETFQCKACKMLNFITKDYNAIKLKDVKAKDIREGFEEATMWAWPEKKMQKFAKDKLKELKNYDKKE